MPPNATTEPAPVDHTPPAWTQDDLRADPHANEQKAEKVRSMFASIARAYDLNNRLHSFGRDRAWRAATVRTAQVRPGEAVLDVACGTGELTRAFSRKSGAARVTGLDYTAEMLDVARAKPAPARGARIEYVQGDAMALPFEDASFDVVSIAFGIRNVQRPEAALAEFFRVLRPGGRVLILEFSRPKNPLVRIGNDVYSGWLMPRTATLLSGDRSGAYFYLPRSIDKFLGAGALADAVRAAGFEAVAQKPMTLGVVTITRGVKS